jgi:ABC-type branched-subunit amino acid transport system ATPase component
VSVSFGAVKALAGVSIQVCEGQFVGLIGPNGAGKTTLFNVVSGFVRPSSGRIRLSGQRIGTWTPARRARQGIARTFQNIGLDKVATVADNLRVARDGGPLGAELARSFGRRAVTAQSLDDRAGSLLDRLGLPDVLGARVETLPVGTAKLVELVAVLLRRPRLLLLDEPASGIGAAERVRLGGLLRELHRDEGLSVLMIEHDMALAMGTADHLYVLNFGTLLSEGPPAEVRRDPRVVEAYLGQATTAAATP